MGESNSATIRKAYEDFAHGNIPSVFAAFDTGITWHVPGHSPLSGDYTGHDQIGGFFRRTMELSGGAFSIGVHKVLAEVLPPELLQDIFSRIFNSLARRLPAHFEEIMPGTETGKQRILDEISQPRGGDGLAELGPFGEVVEPRRPIEGLAQDQERRTRADDFEGRRDRAPVGRPRAPRVE